MSNSIERIASLDSLHKPIIVTVTNDTLVGKILEDSNHGKIIYLVDIYHPFRYGIVDFFILDSISVMENNVEVTLRKYSALSDSFPNNQKDLILAIQLNCILNQDCRINIRQQP
ncbi:MAG: hypothetical protein GC181_10905 [Bacteroidetes bacterium]|nr:hypothetical protein [Bacteroidota bacterium]